MTDYFVHPMGLCESKQIGAGTRVWAFAHVLSGATIGRDCNICDQTFIENDVVIGDRVTIKCGVQIWDGVRLEDDVFVGPNATFTNDPFPRSKEYPVRFSNTVVGKGASIGANATVLPGVRIGQKAMIGAGAVVTRDVPPNAIVVGSPAHIIGYADSAKSSDIDNTTKAESGIIQTAAVEGVSLHRLTRVDDMRGSLAAGEFPADLPFEPKRYFVVFDVPTRKVRGEHAHRECSQFLVCVKGCCSVVVDDGVNRQEFQLERPDIGLFLPPLLWGTQYKYTADAVLLVLASHPYDASDYIRNYEEFLRIRARRDKQSTPAMK